jgi:transposase-like protein
VPASSPRLEHAIADLVARGAPVSQAARWFGIHPRTARGWLDQGRRGRARFVRFAESVEAARLEHEHGLEALVDELRRHVVDGAPYA